MKFCLKARQEESYLKKANEIKFEYRDRKGIQEYYDKYHTTIILVHRFTDEDIDWKEIEQLRILTKDNLILCTDNMLDCADAKDYNCRFYFDNEICSMYQLRAIVEIGVCYIRLGAPLFFKLDKVKAITDIPIRAIPNISYYDNIYRKNGVSGTWIRPEDVEAYEQYIDVLEFADCDKDKEQAMYRIYAEEHEWPGPLSLLVSGLRYDGMNRMIPPEISQKRMNCGQRCIEQGVCRICYNMLELADVDKMREYRDTVYPDGVHLNKN